jgi:hypothetical protein
MACHRPRSHVIFTSRRQLQGHACDRAGSAAKCQMHTCPTTARRSRPTCLKESSSSSNSSSRANQRGPASCPDSISPLPCRSRQPQTPRKQTGRFRKTGTVGSTLKPQRHSRSSRRVTSRVKRTGYIERRVLTFTLLPFQAPHSVAAKPIPQSVTVKLPKGTPGQPLQTPQLIVAKKTYPPGAKDPAAAVQAGQVCSLLKEGTSGWILVLPPTGVEGEVDGKEKEEERGPGTACLHSATYTALGSACMMMKFRVWDRGIPCFA